MLDRVLKVATLTVGALAISFGLFLSVKAPDALLKELMWFFATLNIAAGTILLIWQRQGKQWLGMFIK
ncbi:hypothetical protein AAG587_17100 [Vreelandella neptunia]|jgi:hypothetical protein|uniref:hypothetical protein n=1 Tax=Vreelandella neptunia TaxID=115551 RepID=UPI00315A5C1B